MRWGPHNKQTVLDLSKDESYLYVKNNRSVYSRMIEEIEQQLYAMDDWGSDEVFFIKRKRLKRKILSKLNRAMSAIEEIAWSLRSEQEDIEGKIIQEALSAPIAARKVNLMSVQDGNDVSINDDPAYTEKVFNPQRSSWMQSREGVEK